MKRSYKTLIRGLLGLALLAAVLVLAKPGRVLEVLRGAQPGWLLIGFALAIASNAASAVRWRALARWMGSELSTREAQRWYFQAMGLNALMPGAVVGGDVYRAVMLRRAGQDTLASSWSVILDRVSGLWMLGIIGALGAACSADALSKALHVGAPVLQALALVAAAILMALPWTLPPLMRRWGGVLRRWFGPLQAAALRPDFSRQIWVQAAASALVQVLSAAALAAGALALGVKLSPTAWAFAMAPIFLMAALPVSVGGWGTREAASVGTLALFGVDPALAVGAAVIYGVYGLLQGALGAMAFGFPAQAGKSTSASLNPPA